MLMRQFVLLSGLLAGSMVSLPARWAHAGPLLDWLFHRPAYGPAVPVGAPYPVTAGYAPYTAGYPATGYAAPATLPYSTGYTPYGVALPGSAYRYGAGYTPNTSYSLPTYGTYYGANSPVVGAGGYGYLAQRPANEAITMAPAVVPSTAMPQTMMPQTMMPQTLPQTVMPSNAPVTLVPDYRSTASRVPVTYYRPVLTTDPNTGSQVVTLAPCSSYEYQTQRVPTWGLTQVYNGGATLPATMPTVPPVTSPTYSLPRGGVPLAGPVISTQPYATAYGAYPTVPGSVVTPLNSTPGSIITPATPGTIPATPYSSGYPNYASNLGNYSTMQPPPYTPPVSAYPTVPYNGTTTYYGSGSTGGGSTGTFAPTTSIPYGTSPIGSSPYGSTTSPGLPPLQSTITPAAPGVYPPINNAPGSVLPPGSPSNDPAAGVTPSLPPAFNSGARLESKPQLQNIVQEPINTSRITPAAPTPASPTEVKQNTASEGLLPVPVPDDFDHEPRYNPGLLKDKDATASKAVAGDMQTAWGSKPIRWASLKSSSVIQPKSELSIELPPAELRDKPRSTPAEVNIEIPEINFPPVQPARLQPQPQPPVPAPAKPKLRTDVWQAVK